MDDKMWTTETETMEDEMRSQLREQLDRLTAIQQRDLVRSRQERQREREQMAHWQETERELRDRMLGANWPDPPRDRRETEVERKRETIGFLKDFNMMDGKLPKEKKEDKILKPLPDELFEID